MADAQVTNSILIIGAGVFGLTTAYELAKHAQFTETQITVIDRSDFPANDAASIDISRVVRADYSDPAYAALAARAQQLWRSEWGADGRYHETGLVLTATEGKQKYLKAAFGNVKEFNTKYASTASDDKSLTEAGAESTGVQWLDGPDSVRKATGCDGVSGDIGYVNWRSGWADAEATMRWLHGKVQETGRVEIVTGTVTRLLFSKDHKQVLGVRYKSASHAGSTSELELRADLTVLATGGWTSTLLDMQGRLKTTAQSLAYVPVSDSQAERLSKLPVQLNVSTGCFLMPPPPPSKQITFDHKSSDSTRRLFLKIARHAHGYLNPSTIPHPEPHKLQDAQGAPAYQTSIPLPSKIKQQAIHTLPPKAFDTLDTYLSTLFPAPTSRHQEDHDDNGREWIPRLSPGHTRLCHYTDTPTGDFLIDYHPDYSSSSHGSSSRLGSLFIATGGSGHAFKFAPVLGSCIVQRLADGKTYAEGFENGRWSWDKHQSQSGSWAVKDGIRDDAEFGDEVDQVLSM